MKRIRLYFSRIFFTLVINSIVLTGLQAQMDCASTLRYRYTNPPYQFDEQSRSAICYSGQKYEYNVSLHSGSDYRFSFFASTVFDNNIRFKIINSATGELLLDLPGEAAGNNTSAVLQDYFDDKQNKYIHPYYDIYPEKDSNYKIIVEVGELSPTVGSTSLSINSDQKKGCVTIFLQSKCSEEYGF